MSGNRFSDWDPEEVEVLEVPINPDDLIPPPTPAVTGDGMVVYEDNRIFAFFDEAWKPTQRADAFFVKVWDRDEEGNDRMQIIELDVP